MHPDIMACVEEQREWDIYGRTFFARSSTSRSASVKAWCCDAATKLKVQTSSNLEKLRQTLPVSRLSPKSKRGAATAVLAVEAGEISCASLEGACCGLMPSESSMSATTTATTAAEAAASDVYHSLAVDGDEEEDTLSRSRSKTLYKEGNSTRHGSIGVRRVFPKRGGLLQGDRFDPIFGQEYSVDNPSAVANTAVRSGYHHGPPRRFPATHASGSMFRDDFALDRQQEAFYDDDEIFNPAFNFDAA